MNIIMGIIGFLFCYLYDFNQVYLHKNWLRGSFFIGNVLLASASILLWVPYVVSPTFDFISIGLLLLYFVFVGLLIYTLFFALPFHTTYAQQKSNKTCNVGVYALCRHPGFWCMLLLYAVQSLLIHNEQMWLAFIVFNMLNLGYIIIQDTYIFVILFKDYRQYKKQVPFLIFNRNSVRNCMRTLGKGESNET